MIESEADFLERVAVVAIKAYRGDEYCNGMNSMKDALRAVSNLWAERHAAFVESFKDSPPFRNDRKARAALMLAANAIRRGRVLSDREKLENLTAALAESSQ